MKPTGHPRTMRVAWLLPPALLLGGCLEVEQHPPWNHGQYDGKSDQRVHEARFHTDRLAWNAAVTDRTLQQDEYRRAKAEFGRSHVASTSNRP